jgi:hypothetical protein
VSTLRATPPPATETPEERLAQAVTHLEYLGYIVEHQSDGWSFASHPYRYDFHLRAFDGGIRLYAAINTEAPIGPLRSAWLEFLNDASERSLVARFSLFEDKSGVWLIRLRALVSGAYSRSVFGTAIDMWHDDLELLRCKPAFAEQASGADAAAASAFAANLTLN